MMEWDINDATIPNTVNHYDPYQDWPDDHIRLVYPLNSEPARRHSSGWAMRNTNNHNVHILKKSCLGVLMCSRRCQLGGVGVAQLRLRPAICDKARKKQLGRPCPNPKCGGGSLILVPCKGNSGFPCTHFWRHTGNAVFFQAKGVHDHPRPEVKNNNVEVRKTIGAGKAGHLPTPRKGAGSSNPEPRPLINPLINPLPRARGKVGRKPKSVKKETAVYTPPTPSQTSGCTHKPPSFAPSSYPPPKRSSRLQPIPHPPKPHSTPYQGPYPDSNSYHTPSTCPNYPSPGNSHNHSKPVSFPDWYFLPEEPPQKPSYPSTTSTCPGCGQPQWYCSCGYGHHTHSQDFLQPAAPEPACAPFNNNLDTFKPSDIFNFEVNLNLNYSSYTTTPTNHTHYVHTQPQTQNPPHVSTPSYYGVAEESHFTGGAPPTASYTGGCVQGQTHPVPGYNGNSYYDWNSGNSSASINVVGSGCGNMYQ